MATQTQEAPTVPEEQKTSGVKQTAERDVKIFQAFFTKFTNDWVMNFAAGLAFNLITAILPMLIAIIAIAGYTIGNLNPTIYANLLTSLQSIFTNQLLTFRSLRREKIELRIHRTKQTKNLLMKSSQPQNLGVPA